MAWIESHQELGRHPKTKRLARLLQTSLPATVGHLQYLWWWALDFAQDGDLTGYEAAELADAALWEGDPAMFLTALQQAGFMDARATLHDWDQYAGRLVDQRQANAAKQRAWRERKKTPRDITPTANIGDTSPNRDVTVTSPSRNGATVQYSTEHNRESDLPPAPAREGLPSHADPMPIPFPSDDDPDWTAVGHARQRVTPSDDPAVATGERQTRPRRVALPPDWALTPDRAAWAASQCPHVISPLTATAKFTTHYRAGPDRRTLAEWDSKWQAWLLGDETRALDEAARRGIKAPTATTGQSAENPATREYLDMRRAALAARDAKIAARRGVQ